MYKILIVEDDPVIAAAIEKSFAPWGLEAHTVKDFSDVTGEFVRENAHLVLMDISLPFFNGFYWCQQIRKISKAPVIFISSASENMNIVMAMNMGGDDFISKPFDISVLVAKVQAMLRRTYDFAHSTALMECQGVILNTADSTLFCNESSVELTKNELRIVSTLMEHRGAAVSRSELMQKLWESDSYIDENTLSVNIARLRKKLSEVGASDFIRTIKGVGYIVE